MNKRAVFPVQRGLSLLLALLLCLSVAFAEEGAEPAAATSPIPNAAVPRGADAGIPALCTGIPAAADRTSETKEVQGYDFNLKLSLDIAEAQPTARTRMKGYADLLETITLRGTFFTWPERNYFDLSVEIISGEANAAPISLRFYNTVTNVMMSSPLLGEQPVLFSTDNLLAFAFKTYEHLGLNLQYPVLLLPCSYEFAFRYLRESWNAHIAPTPQSHTVSPEDIEIFAGAIARFTEEDGSNLNALLKVLGICEGYDENVESEIMNMPAYLTETLTEGGAVECIVKKGSEEWKCGGRTIYSHTLSKTEENISVDFPATENGFRPAFSLKSRMQKDKISSDLSFGWLSGDPDSAQDIFSVSLSTKDHPARWPMETDATAELSLTGSLFPPVRMSASLKSDAAGKLELKIKSPADSSLVGGTVLTVSGTVVPTDCTAVTCSGADLRKAVDILVSNDVTLNAWLSGVIPNAASGILDFLSVVPASTYQSILDDLTETGVLSMLFGVD